MTILPMAALAATALLAGGAAAPSYAVASRIAGPDGGWDLAAVDEAGATLFVARTLGVMKVDLASGTVTPALVPLQGGHGVVAIPGSNRVVATGGGSGAATLFEGDTGKVVATIPTGKNPDAVAWDPATRTAWVMNPGSGDVTVIDPLAAKAVATIPVGGGLELGAADGAGRLYVNVEDKNEVAVLDTRARTLITRFPLAGCDGPTGIAYAVKARLVISACGNGVAVFSAPDGHAVATVKIGPRPDGAAFDEARGLALIPSGGEGTLSVIAVSPKPHLVQTVTTARGARTIALDAKTGAVYLPSAQYLPAVGSARPKAAPGTFAIIKVAPTGAAR